MSSLDALGYRLRPARSSPEGALVLLHGRGADENDLFALFDMLDPEGRLVGASPRGPLSLPPGGAHWYQVREIGFPDPVTFGPTFDTLTGWVDAFLEDNGISMDRTVIGGFSQGAVMSYGVALAAGRPRPAGLMPFSGFMPTVDGLDLDLSDLDGFPVAIGHGTLDPVIGVEWGRRAKEALEQAGADVIFRESPMQHSIDPGWVAELEGWLAARLP